MQDSLLNKIQEISEGIFNEKQKQFATDLYLFSKNLLQNDKYLIIAYFSALDSLPQETAKELSFLYGTDVIQKLSLLRRISNISFQGINKRLSDLRNEFVQLTQDINVIIIKLSERLLRLKETDKLNSPDKLLLSEECLYLYSPIAQRLGIRQIYTEMEDISFKNLFPDEFKTLNSLVEKRRPQLERKLKEMIALIKYKLSKNNISCTVHGRVKRIYSIFRKLKNKGITIDKIFDLMALRVITDTVENCYQTLGLVHQNWIPIEGRFRDWVAFPKPNGYRSIQTTIITNSGDKFEVQIRTSEMHREAEYGSSAHWAYKEGSSGDARITKLREFLENDEYFLNPLQLHEMLSSESKSTQIHVLTPKGEIKALPEGSTPVDFAFAIHTDLGYKITGARVNDKFVKLNTLLSSGDVIEIITNKAAKPSRDWLKFVKTSKARSKILLWLKKNEQEELIAEGKRIWEKFKKNYKKFLLGKDDEQIFKNNLIKVGFKHSDDFYSSIAIKSIKLTLGLIRRLYPNAFEKPERIKKSEISVSKTTDILPIKIEGLTKIGMKTAKCCNPTSKDEIVAFVTRNSEVKIHSVDCKFVNMEYIEKDRIKKAEWLNGKTDIKN